MLGCGGAKWCGMTYGLRGSGARAISATCSGREVVEPGARAKTSVLDAIGCHGRDTTQQQVSWIQAFPCAMQVLLQQIEVWFNSFRN